MEKVSANTLTGAATGVHLTGALGQVVFIDQKAKKILPKILARVLTLLVVRENILYVSIRLSIDKRAWWSKAKPVINKQERLDYILINMRLRFPSNWYRSKWLPWALVLSLKFYLQKGKNRDVTITTIRESFSEALNKKIFKWHFYMHQYQYDSFTKTFRLKVGKHSPLHRSCLKSCGTTQTQTNEIS